MDVIIQSRGFTAGAGFEEFIRQKLEKLEVLSSEIIRANVTLFEGPESESANKYCEVRLEVPGYDHFVKKNDQDFERAVLECVEALQKILRRNKDKEISSRNQ